MKIIKAENSHRVDIEKLLTEFYQYLYTNIRNIYQMKTEEFKDLTKSVKCEVERFLSQDIYTLLAINDGEVIGYISGEIKINPQKKYDIFGYIEDFFVTNKYRRKGIGKLLLKKMKENFLQKKCKYISLFCNINNTRSIKFYTREGFVPSAIEYQLNLIDKH